MSFLTILPMAFVMVAGPQILSAFFLATSQRWKANSAAYVGGAAVSITVVVSLAYFLSSGAERDDGTNTTLDALVLVLLLAAMVHVFLARKTSEPPKWMGRLATATPGLSFRLGALLLGIFPTDIFTSVAVGAYLASHGEAWWQFLPFLGLTLLLLALPALLLLMLGRRAEELLPRVRDWMNDNSWLVSEAVLLLFVAISISDLAG